MPENIASLLTDDITTWQKVIEFDSTRQNFKKQLSQQLNKNSNLDTQTINNQLQRIQMIEGLLLIHNLTSDVLETLNNFKNNEGIYNSHNVNKAILKQLNQIIYHNPLSPTDITFDTVKLKDLTFGLEFKNQHLKLVHDSTAEISIQNYILQLEAVFDNTDLDLASRPNEYDIPYLIRQYSNHNIKKIIKGRQIQRIRANQPPRADILDRILFELYLANQYQASLQQKVISWHVRNNTKWLTDPFIQTLFKAGLIDNNAKQLLDTVRTDNELFF